MIKTRAQHSISDELLSEDNERVYFESFPWHPGRNRPVSPNQRGYLGQILPSPDEIVSEYVSNVIPGR